MIPIGLAILQLYPKPNTAVTNLAVEPYTFNAKRVENLDEGSARVDYKLTSKDDFLLQYNYFNDPSIEPSLSLCSSGVLPSAGCVQNQISTLGSINETHIISAHWLNEIRLGFDRLEQPRIGTDNSNTSFPKVNGCLQRFAPYPGEPSTAARPTTTVSGLWFDHPPLHQPARSIAGIITTIWSTTSTGRDGKHNVKFGVNLHAGPLRPTVFVSYGNRRLRLQCHGQYRPRTSRPAVPSADLALGYAATAPPAARQHLTFQARYSSYGLAFSLEDDWKVHPRASPSTSALRYEYFQPHLTTPHNVMSNYVLPSYHRRSNLERQHPGRGLQGGSRLASVYQGDLKQLRSTRRSSPTQPFGDAHRTVVHASYGIFYNSPVDRQRRQPLD